MADSNLSIDFQPLVGMTQMIRRLKAMEMAHLIRIQVFSDSVKFKSSFGITVRCFKLPTANEFYHNVETIHRKDAIDISLERYERGATFLCRTLLSNQFGFKLILEIRKLDN